MTIWITFLSFSIKLNCFFIFSIFIKLFEFSMFNIN